MRAHSTELLPNPTYTIRRHSPVLNYPHFSHIRTHKHNNTMKHTLRAVWNNAGSFCLSLTGMLSGSFSSEYMADTPTHWIRTQLSLFSSPLFVWESVEVLRVFLIAGFLQHVDKNGLEKKKNYEQSLLSHLSLLLPMSQQPAAISPVLSPSLIISLPLFICPLLSSLNHFLSFLCSFSCSLKISLTIFTHKSLQ